MKKASSLGLLTYITYFPYNNSAVKAAMKQQKKYKLGEGGGKCERIASIKLKTHCITHTRTHHDNNNDRVSKKKKKKIG